MPGSSSRIVAAQLSFDGPAVPAGDIKQRVAALLEQHPDARQDYARLVFYYWRDCDGMSALFARFPGLETAFLDFIAGRATSWKTIQNRAMEVQNENPDLEAAPAVQRLRQQQARAGVIK